MSKPRLILGAESLLPGNGGICRVARLVARVLGEQVAAGQIDASAISLSDPTPVDDLTIPVKNHAGSRPRFVAGIAAAALSNSHFIYDFVGMARAHCRLPLLKRPMMIYLHGIEMWEGTRPDRVRTARSAEALVVNSQYTLDRAQRLHGRFPAEAKVCWLATESDTTPTTHPDLDGPPTVMILARMDEGGGYKGHRELIAAWPAVRQAVPDALLRIVGRGPGYNDVAALAAASPAAAGIEMTGFVADADVERLWPRTTVLAMPSRKEGFGLVYIEAMRHAVPVIASVHDAAPEVNLDGQTGYNVDLDRVPSDLAGRLIDLLRDRAAAAAMGRRGQDRWRDHFRYSAFRDRFLPSLHAFTQQ